MFGTNCNFNLLYCAGNAVQPFVLAFLWKCTTVQSKKGRKREEIPGAPARKARQVNRSSPAEDACKKRNGAPKRKGSGSISPPLTAKFISNSRLYLLALYSSHPAELPSPARLLPFPNSRPPHFLLPFLTIFMTPTPHKNTKFTHSTVCSSIGHHKI
jgi:hypothetical protein